MKYGPHMELFIRREQESGVWLRDLKCVWQEEGPVVPVADFPSREGIDLPVTDSNYSKCQGERSSLFTIAQQSLNISM